MSGQAFISFLLSCLVGLALPAAAAAPARISEAYGKLPLYFEANRGQTHADVRFLARGGGYRLYLTSGEAVLALTRPTPSVLRMRFVGATRAASVSGMDELQAKTNYFIGNDPAKWRTDIPTYAKVHYRELYPGIDLVYYGHQQQLEYDFVVSPGADPREILLDIKGAERLEIDTQGDLIMHAPGRALRQHKPRIYQEIGGTRREIGGGYVLRKQHQVGFQIASYDRTRPLIIDPVLSYSTYLGGTGDEEPWAIAADSLGNAYVTGQTSSVDFPTTPGSLQPTYGGGSLDVFVAKLNQTGSALVYATYLGGSGDEGGAFGIAVDTLGNAYVSGGTASTNFPTTPGAFQTALRGRFNSFVTKLNPTGSALIYSTYLGGSQGEGGITRIALDALGNAYVAGHTSSPDFPTTPGAYRTTFPVGAAVAPYVTKLNPTGSGLVYSTFLGGSNGLFDGLFKETIAIAVDASGNAYVAGGTAANNFPTTPGAFQTTSGGGFADAFVTKLNAAGSALLYSTYLASAGFEMADGIAVDSTGNAYVTGFTDSTSFPTTAGSFQTTFIGSSAGFITKLNATGSALVYSTFLAGSGIDGDQTTAIAVDALGNAYVTGATSSADFPTTSGAFQSTLGGPGAFNAFLTTFNATGSTLLYSTYLGGSFTDQGLGVALDTANNVYATGIATSANFPTTPGAFQSSHRGGEDGFVVKLGAVVSLPPPPPPPPPPASIGKVTGGGSIDVARGIGTFGFNVEHGAADAPIVGDLQYVNHASGANVHSMAFTSFVITGNVATFGGSCTNNGAPCTFTVTVTDLGEPGRNDSFSISVDAGPAEGAGEKLRGGNIQIHR